MDERVVESADAIVSLDDDASRDAFRLGVEAYVIQKKKPAKFLVRRRFRDAGFRPTSQIWDPESKFGIWSIGGFRSAPVSRVGVQWCGFRCVVAR